MAKLLYDTTKNKDLLYITKVDILDPFCIIDTGKTKYVVIDHREFGLLQEKNTDSDVVPVLLEDVYKEMGAGKKFSDIAFYLLQKYGVDKKEIEVSSSFPVGLADALREKGIILTLVSFICPQRAVKTES